MDPIWLDNYPPGVPTGYVVDPDETLIDAMEATFAAWPGNRAFANMGHSLTFAETDRLSRQFAAYLQRDLKLMQGDRVAIMLPNLLQYPVAMLGCLRAGMVVVNVNPMYTPRELEHQLHDAGAKAIVIYSGSAHVLEEVLEHTDIAHILVSNVGDLLPLPMRVLANFVVRFVKRMVPAYSLPNAQSFRAILGTPVGDYVRPDNIIGKDVAILQYTGGTTGLSKGAMLSHSNLLANTRQVNSWFGALDVPGEEIIITALPLYHVYALTVNCFAYFVKGGLNMLITDPRDTAAMVKEMGKWPFTAMTGVNTLFQSLARHPDIAKVDFSHLKVASAGGMAVQEATAREWVEVTGTQIIEGYGLSETSPVITTNPLDLPEFNGCVGLPLPGTDVSIRNDDGNEVPPGEAGELYVKGPQVMLGYWNNPEATSKVTSTDGYFRTGDMATIDERGYLKIVDRKKDMIIVSGFKVYPNEIENIVTQHPDILEAACVGVPGDDPGEEDVKLFVVIREGADISPQSVRDYCKENMTAYKVPGAIEFVDHLPKSNVGKVLRRELRGQ
ncbi:MAG: long-chain-fatty-acid--CoA ligase [Chromatiales bacterium]|jgi:long-chain acyl-CoA synthetase|nr:long-chain-fatty-acid--CoA ligase [Chromatiales bacterium]MDP7094220.1 AMP-binding protein [Gammaproteobacteria bacterium]